MKANLRTYRSIRFSRNRVREHILEQERLGLTPSRTLREKLDQLEDECTFWFLLCVKQGLIETHEDVRRVAA